MGPLKGLKVVEFVGLGPGPFAGMMLADMGAEVIAIERPGSSQNAMLEYDICRRGKIFVELDLKSGDDKQAALKLVSDSDVLIEGARPGVMERLGLGPEECFAVNAALVYGRMTGWGQSGPLSQCAGHDLNYIAISGALFSMGVADSAQPVPLNLIGDYGGGAMFLAFGIVCAVLEARQSHMGQVVDASMVEGSSLLMSLFHSFRAGGQWNDTRGSNFLDGGAHFYSVYETSDGKFVSLAAIEGQFLREFIRLTELDEAWLERHMDRATWPELKAELGKLFKTRTQSEWCGLLEGTDSCFAPVLPFWEAHQHPQNLHRGSFIELSGVVQPAPAPKFSRTKPEINGASTIGGLRYHDRIRPTSGRI
ncbi:MAG: CaiB/BaiF CoA-transferase family protein [Parvibaculaceae bacterium]